MDAALTEIMKNRFSAMVEEAATIAYRTAHTTFVKQTQDFQVALARPEGDFFAFPTMTGATSSVCQSITGLTEDFADAVEPGDILISNDPFRTRGLVTHTMDIHLARPIFHQSRLVCWAWAFVHASDIGGAVPGSISPDLTEIFQEGIRIRPTKLRRAGELNRDIINLLHDNSRIGSQVWGDLEAMQSAMRLLDRRVSQMCERIGIDTFVEGTRNVMAYAESKARSVIGRLKDGSYVFSDYLDGAGGDDAVHIRCRLTISGDTAEIDYSGSDPQVNAALNFPTGSRSHPLLCLALTNYIQTVEPSTPVNGGMMRPITSRATLGSVMNCSFPAAMGNRWVAVMRTYDALMGCLNQAVPGGISACGAGQAGIISAAWTEPDTGRSSVAVVEPFSGGSGGRVKIDGVDANDTMVGFLKSTPIEDVEVDTPLLLRRHELVPESFGHGRHRGGSSVRIEIECLAPEITMTVRGLDRFRFQPWGVFGGTPGRSGSAVLNPGPQQTDLGRIRVLRLVDGDRLSLISPSGGGFGDPLDRPPEQVLDDVERGFLGMETARAIYGVVLRDGAVDADATETRREELRGGRKEGSWVAQGESRRAYEEAWPAEASAALASAILEAPQGRRRFLFTALRKELDGRRPLPSPSKIAEAVAHAAKS